MDALTFLRYWRTNAADTTTTTTTTTVTGVSSPTSKTEDDNNNNNNDNENENDNGPFFDLEFSLPAEENEEEECDGSESSDDESENESELKLTFMSNSSGDSTADVHVSVSPSDELFFKGGFVPVDNTSEMTSKPPQFRLSLMKSATKFRVMMLKFRKSKLNSSNASNTSTSSNASSSSNSNSKEEKQKSDRNSLKPSKNLQNENEPVSVSGSGSGSSDEKLFSKEMMEKYLRKVKPLYVAVSQKYGEKLKLKADSSSSTNPRREKQATSSEVVKQGTNLPTGLRVVCKRLGKSLSASTAVVAGVPGATPSQRRDDSLIQQQDGIQSAILHCKRSFKASRDCDGSLSLVKSVSEPVMVAGEIEKS